MPIIELVEPNELQAYYDHIVRLEAESGKTLETTFTPIDELSRQPFSIIESKEKERADKSISDVGWGRLWVLKEESEIYGHIQLVHEPKVRSSLHRATLMGGIENSHRSLGFGSKLMKTAIQWATAQESLDWIDIFVFGNNEQSLRLSKAFGFVESGTTVDMFRINGLPITDIKMVLKLR